MSETRPRRLTNLDCILQAEECRHLARIALSSEHRIMLHHMADNLNRIATDIEARAKQPFPQLVWVSGSQSDRYGDGQDRTIRIDR
jgi:hypothetical protein